MRSSMCGCGAEIPYSGRGRPRRKCQRCLAAARRAGRAIPAPFHHDDEIRRLYESGFNMTEIGAHLGITRERVRQILARQQVPTWSGSAAGWGATTDPLMVARAARISSSCADCAERCGVSAIAVTRCLAGLGMLEPCRRLWRMRRKRARRDRLTAAIRGWAERHGNRMPTQRECNAHADLPTHTDVVQVFGSMNGAARALGFPERRPGAPGHIRRPPTTESAA
jgi:hypothetical protein